MKWLTRKFVLAVLGVVVVLGGLALGLRWAVDSSSGTKKNIVVILPTVRNPFWLEVKRGVEKAGRELGSAASIRISAGSGDAAAGAQNEYLKTYLQRGGVDALVLGPASATDPVPLLSDYTRAGIPIVVIDSRLDEQTMLKHGAKVAAVITSNNRQGGQLAAGELAAAIGTGPRNVLLLRGSPVHETAMLRSSGFLDARPKNWTIIERNGEWDTSKAYELTATEIQRGPIDGIFANSDAMALGAVAALEATSTPIQQWPKVVGFDATEDGTKAVQEGKMFATIKQKPSLMGQKGVLAAWAILKKETVLPIEELDVEPVRR